MVEGTAGGTTFDFSGRIVLITGAAGNLGTAVTAAFVAAGASLALVEHRLDSLQAAYAGLAERPDVHFFEADLTDEAAVERLGEAVLRQAGRVDVLVNLAGGFKMGTPVHETGRQTWEFMLNLNAGTVFLVSRAFIPHMIERGSGKIVNIAGKPGLEGNPRAAAYSAAKSAVLRLTESMAAELKSSGINVNCVVPGTMDTPENREAMPKARVEKWVSPDQVASVILFLASDAAAAIHGAAIPVYGLG